MKVNFKIPAKDLIPISAAEYEVNFDDIFDFIHWIEAISKQTHPGTRLYIEVKTTKMC